MEENEEYSRKLECTGLRYFMNLEIYGTINTDYLLISSNYLMLKSSGFSHVSKMLAKSY